MSNNTQTRKMSLIEKLCETSFAFVLSVLFSPLFFAINGVETNTTQNIGVVACFTVLAIARGYFVRRLFNKFS